MHITRYTDYSLRVLVYLAVEPKRFTTISAIAKSYDISKNHLMKIVQYLNAEGYLLAVRGKNGGIKLDKDPIDISIGALVRELEEGSKLVECHSEGNQCVITPSCQLKNIFSRAQQAFYEELDNYTLADLVGEDYRHRLQEILAIDVS